MNNLEICFYLIIILTTFFVYFYLFKNIKFAFISAILSMPIWIFIINKASQYVNYDSGMYLYRYIHVPGILNHYPNSLQAYRLTQVIASTYALMIPVSIQNAIGIGTFEGIGKMLHLYAGILLMFMIFYIIIRKFLKSLKLTSMQEFVFFMFYLYFIMAYPTLISELKGFKYDLLSDTVAALAFFISLYSVMEKKNKTLTIALVLASLAACEKISATPILLICLTIYVWAKTDGVNEIYYFKNQIQNLLKGLGIVFIVPIILYFYSFVFILNGEYYPIGIESLGYHFYSIFQPFLGYSVHTDRPQLLTILTMILVIFAVYTIHLFEKLFLNRGAKIYRMFCQWLPRINGVFILCTIFIGVISTFLIKVHIIPWGKFLEGECTSVPSFNNIYYAFGAKTKMGQYLLFTCASYANLVNSFATVQLICLVIFSILCITGIINKKNKYCDLLNLTILGSNFIILLFALTGTQYNARYKLLFIIIQNIAAIILSAEIMIQIVDKIKKINKVFFSVIGVSAIVLINLEIASFYPVNYNFIPIWNNIEQKSFPKQAEQSVVEISCFQEQNMLTGEILKSYADKNGIEYQNITIVRDTHNDDYEEDWLSNPGFKWGVPGNYSANDFYIYSRQKIIQNGKEKFMEEVEPFATISYRGIIVAWIYQGDQIADYCNK